MGLRATPGTTRPAGSTPPGRAPHPCSNKPFRYIDDIEAEIFATTYAAWNSLLLDGKRVSDETIVREAGENWHPDKLEIPRDQFFSSIEWMRERRLTPKGQGKKVLPKAG